MLLADSSALTAYTPRVEMPPRPPAVPTPRTAAFTTAVRAFLALPRAQVRSLLHGFWRVSPGRKAFRLAMVALVCQAWLLLFWGTGVGLRHLIAIDPALGPVVVSNVFHLALLMLLTMLGFSSVLVSLAHLFLAEDLPFLGTVPVPAGALFFVKGVEVAAVAAWMPLVFGSAVVAAFGAVCRATAAYYPLAGVCLLLLLAIPTALGIVLTVLLVRLMPARRTRDVLFLLILLVLVAVLLVLRAMRPERLADPEALRDFSQLLAQLRLPVAERLPSAWAAEALLPYLEPLRGASSWGVASASGVSSTGPHAVLHSALPPLLALLAAAVLACGLGWAAFSVLFRTSLSATLSSRAGRPTRWQRAGLLLLAPTRLLPRRIETIVRKDLLHLGRDPTQWAQIALVVALVLVYLINIYVFPLEDLRVVHLTRDSAADLMACMNLTLAGFVLTAVALRFVFTLVSMEGRAAWVMLHSPARPRVWLGAKIAVGVPFLLAFGLALVGGSSIILQTTPAFTVASVAITVLLVVGISGIGVGLGAVMPDFSADSPAKIVGGLGGLVFMLVALLYTGLLLLFLAYPLWGLHRLSRGHALESHQLGMVVVLASLAVVGTAAALALPLWLGARSLEQRE